MKSWMELLHMRMQSTDMAIHVRTVLAIEAFDSGVHGHVPADTLACVEQSPTNVTLNTKEINQFNQKYI